MRDSPCLTKPRVRLLTEEDIDAVIVAAKGRRAMEGVPGHGGKNADYLIGDTLIELKVLEKEGMLSPERQGKLAKLFGDIDPHRPVIVIDPERLNDDQRRQYIRILETPIKTAVSKARSQLKQTRNRISESKKNVLMVINNSYTALDNDALRDLVVHRVRNDTNEIDGVIVGGCYFYSDGIDVWAIWPLEYVPIAPDKEFPEFDAIKKAWNELSETMMTDIIIGRRSSEPQKEAAGDACFEHEGITYVKPALQVGTPSEIYGSRRPRANHLDFTDCPTVAITFPDISGAEFERIHAAMPEEPLLASWSKWRSHYHCAETTGTVLKPFVPMEVTRRGWQGWCKRHARPLDMASLRAYANSRFSEEIQRRLDDMKEVTGSPPRSLRCVAVITEVIGQDAANDMSTIGLASYHPAKAPEFTPLVIHARIQLNHAMALACSYAVQYGIGAVYWKEDLTYAWT